MPKGPFQVASKSIDDQTVITTSAVSVGRCVSFAGFQIITAGAIVRGIAKSDATIGKSLSIGVMGTTCAQIGVGGAAVGDPLTSEAVTGKLIVATSGQVILARALQVAVADDYIEIFITREGKA